MPSDAPWARYDPRIRLLVSGQEMPCIRCSVDYELNAIPQAAATLAVGRDTYSGAPSPVHGLVENFVDRAPAEIWINPYAQGPSDSSAAQPGDLGLPGGWVRIFDGFVTGAGFSRSRGHAQFTIQMENWLSELGFSSIFSKMSHPANPGKYSFGALGPTGSAGAVWANMALGADLIDAGNLSVDFWGEALKPFFLMLCDMDAFWAWDPALHGEGANDGAKAALQRFNSPWQQPLAMDMTPDADVVANIVAHISETTGDPSQLANQTLWDVLIGSFASEYLFAIVPRVEDAVVAAFLPGYRQNFTTISANTETQIEWMRGLGRPLRGVGILCGTDSTTGATKPGEGADPELGIGGFYSPYAAEDASAKGMVIITQGPAWMTKLYWPSLYGAESTGVSGGNGNGGNPAQRAAGGGNAIGNAVQPGGKAVNNVPDDVKQRLNGIVLPFLSRYAQARYALEKLRTRQAVCSCPFRLDIAPGSTVMVQNAGEQFIAGDPFAAPFFAHVARVSLAVDGEQPMIGTSFHLSHIRSAKENGQDTTSVASHPLYKQTFAGCPLVGNPAKQK
jgi:hypothetical protein